MFAVTQSLLSRPRLTLTCLLLVNLLLLSVQVRSEEGRLLIRSWSLWMFTPLAAGLNLALDGVQEGARKYVFLHNTERENQLLKAENNRLTVELHQLRGLRELTLRVEDYRLLQEQYLFETIAAGVIWKSAPFYSHRLFINIGSRQRIVRSTAVIASEGIVGRVWSSTPFSAEVELITNAGSAAGGVLGNSGLEGVVQGDGSSILSWNYIPNFEDVSVGDIVYTSGTDQIYPKGLPIGRVISSRKGPMTYREIELEPFVDYSRLEEVLVVVANRKDSP
jgi:rod shape-determining protein MreC